VADKDLRKDTLRWAMLGILWTPRMRRALFPNDRDEYNGLCRRCLNAGRHHRETAEHLFLECPDAEEWNAATFCEIQKCLRRLFPRSRPSDLFNWITGSSVQHRLNIGPAGVIGIMPKHLAAELTTIGVPKKRAPRVAAKIVAYLQLRAVARIEDRLKVALNDDPLETPADGDHPEATSPPYQPGSQNTVDTSTSTSASPPGAILDLGPPDVERETRRPSNEHSPTKRPGKRPRDAPPSASRLPCLHTNGKRAQPHHTPTTPTCQGRSKRQSRSPTNSTIGLPLQKSPLQEPSSAPPQPPYPSPLPPPPPPPPPSPPVDPERTPTDEVAHKRRRPITTVSEEPSTPQGESSLGPMEAATSPDSGTQRRPKRSRGAATPAGDQPPRLRRGRSPSPSSQESVTRTRRTGLPPRLASGEYYLDPPRRPGVYGPDTDNRNLPQRKKRRTGDDQAGAPAPGPSGPGDPSRPRPGGDPSSA
jgi:hypothetical protein